MGSEVELDRVEWFNTQDDQPDAPDHELDPPEVATLTATPEGIKACFMVWSPGDPCTCSALLAAQWPEVLKHAPTEAMKEVLKERPGIMVIPADGGETAVEHEIYYQIASHIECSTYPPVKVGEIMIIPDLIEADGKAGKKSKRSK